ncbi:MAG: RICIN domain-containing protein [Acidobacteriaceae bacterium]|nr:RICIN domain-containing protein [Acidobacteriaceae bacterium]
MKTILFSAALSILSLSAYAQNPAGVNFKIVSASGSGNFCMDAQDNRKADGTNVFMYTCHGRENQRWAITTATQGSAIIGTGGYCLDVRGGAKSPGAPVQLYQCHFGGNQRFLIGSDGTIKEQSSGNCLQAKADKDGAPIVLAPCKGAPTEKWRFEQ